MGLFFFVYGLIGSGVACLVWTGLLIYEPFFQQKDFLFVLLGIFLLTLFLNIPRKYNKKLASLNMAIFVILLAAVILSVGTFMESYYGALYAQKKVYHSFFAVFVWSFLSFILIAVMRDRFPWKKRHLSFLAAHVGLLTLFLGSLVTQRYGVDGSLVLEPEKESSWVFLPDRQLGVYASLDGRNLRKIKLEDVDLISKDKNLTWSLGDYKMKVLRYLHHSKRKSQVVEVFEPRALPALQFELKNNRLHFLRWLILSQKSGSETLDLGPAKVTLLSQSFPKTLLIGEKPHLVLKVKDSKWISYKSYKGGRLIAQGVLQKGDVLQPGWMDLQFRLMNYYFRAEQRVSYEPAEFKGEGPLSAVELEFQDKKYWLGLGSVLKVFTEREVFFMTYGRKKTALPFKMQLDQFVRKFYPGTSRAASYESFVNVEGFSNPVRIHMNHPFSYKGFTFYQSSFEEDFQGESLASILSVNFDPGRVLKYYGSFLVLLGSLILLYFRKMKV